MQRAMEAIGETARPFLRKVNKGETQYITLLEFREELDAGTAELPMFTEAGCACFIDEE